MSMRVKLMAVLTARDGKADELELLLLAMLAPSRAEVGNLRWDIWRDQTDPDRFVLDELYIDNEAAMAHRDSAHFKNYAAQVGDLAERTPFTLVPLQVGSQGESIVSRAAFLVTEIHTSS